MWGVAAAVLIALTAAWAVHWIRFPERARGHAHHPIMAPFWGAPAMALMTVGTGTLVLGRSLLGTTVALDADWVLWSAGTALGLVTACWIPYLMVTGQMNGQPTAFGGWLMPVVPPMVSAASGALLVPHAAPGQGRLTLLLACYAMFGIGLLASLIIITQIWARLIGHGVGPAVLVPTLWIVLGPLGQSITAAGVLGTAAAGVLPAPYATGAAVLALLYGVPVWGFAMLWLVLAAAITVRTALTTTGGLPFALTWLSFTFPVGTCVTGTIALAYAATTARCAAPPSCCTPCCWWPGWLSRRGPRTAPPPGGCCGRWLPPPARCLAEPALRVPARREASAPGAPEASASCPGGWRRRVPRPRRPRRPGPHRPRRR